MNSRPSVWLLERRIGTDPFIAGSCGYTIRCLASIMPSRRCGLPLGENIQPMASPPILSRITNMIRTKMRKASFDMMLFPSRNSFGPWTYLLFAKLSNIPIYTADNKFRSSRSLNYPLPVRP